MSPIMSFTINSVMTLKFHKKILFANFEGKMSYFSEI